MSAPPRGKKYVKIIKNKTTGRVRKVGYGAKGFRISPGTKKGDSYCSRSLGIKKKMILRGGESAKKARDPNSPNNLSRKKWRCSGGKSRR